MPVPDTITKADLLAAMQTGWDDLWAYLDTLSEAQLTQPTDAGGWTIKDHVIHLEAWEGSMNDLLQKLPRRAYMGVSQATWERGEIDPINAEIYARFKDMTWAQVKAQFQKSHAELIARIEALPEADLQRPYNYYQPGSPATDTAAHRLGIASYDHYTKHIPWMQAIAAQPVWITTKAEVIAGMQKGWQDFNAYLDALTEQQLTQLTDASGWTAKDHVIHLAVWEDGVNAVFAGQNQMRSMGVDDPDAWKNGDWDKLNAVIYDHNKNLSLAEVRQRFQQVHERLFATVQSLPEEALRRPYNTYQPDSTYSGPVINTLVGNTFHHYAEHQPWIEAIVRKGSSMTEQQVTTKAELLAAIQQNWDAFNAYLDTLSETQLTQPTDAAGWTAKDHVAHLWVWEDGMNAFFQKISRPEHMGIDAETWASGDFDKINAVIQQRYENLSWTEVRRRFQESHERLLKQIQALSDEDLQRPYNYYQPASPATDPAINRLSGNTFQHYAEHQPWIDTIVKSSK